MAVVVVVADIVALQLCKVLVGTSMTLSLRKLFSGKEKGEGVYTGSEAGGRNFSTKHSNAHNQTRQNEKLKVL